MMRLPAELVWHIQQFLPLYDAVNLGLSNRHLHDFTDPNTWRDVRCRRVEDETKGVSYSAGANDQDRWDFLKRLEPQLPSHELCHYCRIFHPRAPGLQSSPWRPVTNPFSSTVGRECDAKEVHFRRWGVGWGFGFRDLYAVMTRHRLTSDHGLPLSDLCVSTDWTYARAYRNLYNASRAPFQRFISYTKLDTEAVIHDDNLLVHRTQRIWVPIHLQGTDVLLRYGAGDIAGDFKICSHHGPQSGDMIYNFTIPFREGLRCILSARLDPDCAEEGEDSLPRIIKRCEDCPTEYCLSFHPHSNSVEIVLDVWQNLGTCESPQSPGWSSCWGTLNPRFGLQSIGDGWRVAWMQSAVGYVGDEHLFSSPGGESAAAHPSSAGVLEDWERLLSDTSATQATTRGISLGVVPQLSKPHYRNLRSSFVNARWDAFTYHRTLPSFPFEFRGFDGELVPATHLRYTRTIYRESQRPRGGYCGGARLPVSGAPTTGQTAGPATNTATTVTMTTAGVSVTVATTNASLTITTANAP